jgi:CheY-like chemotaxis protein
MEKPHVLVVDDDKTSLDITKLFLKELYEIDTAENGVEAIKKTETKKYDAILMDIGLGRGMNGVEATKKIRGNRDYKDVPIVAVTAYVMRGDKEEFLNAGCSHYLSKPFESAKLKELLKSILSI